MSEFKFILNDIELEDHPSGWEDFTERIVRDNDVYGITFNYDIDLIFAGDGYTVLNNLVVDGLCDEVTLIIQQKTCETFEEVCSLLIKSSDVTVNINQCTAECKVTDGGYYGMIHNNKNVPVNLSAEETKNGETMTAATLISTDVFEPEQSGGAIQFYGTQRVGVEVINALETVLTYITDGRITTVNSDYFDGLTWDEIPSGATDDYGQMIFMFFTGVGLRTGSTSSYPTINFEETMKTLNAMHGVWWSIEGGEMRLEPYDYFFSEVDENSVEILSQPDIERSTDTEVLYSSVSLGSPDAEVENFVSNNYPTPVNWSMPYLELISHAPQEYALQGVCNTENQLDLRPAHIIDSNLIERQVYIGENTPSSERPDQTYDTNVFYIQCVYNETQSEYQTAWSEWFLLPTSPVRGYTFNPYLTNANVIKRHGVQSNYSFYFTSDDDKFRAETTGIGLTDSSAGYAESTFISYDINPGQDIDITKVHPISFNDDTNSPNFDSNGNYDTSTSRYVAPASTVYGFETRVFVKKVYDKLQEIADPSNIFNTWEVPLGIRTVPKVAVQATITVYESDGVTIAQENIPIGLTSILGWVSESLGDFGYIVVSAPYTETVLAPTAFQNPTTGGWENPLPCPIGSVLLYLQSGQQVEIGLNFGIYPHYSSSVLNQRIVRYAGFNESYFRCNFILETGGEFEAIDPETYRSLIYEFNRGLTSDQWEGIKNDPKRAFQITPGLDNYITTHLKEVSRNFATGETTFELMANRDQPYI